MLAGFWSLTWLEIKVFLREPMGVIGTLVIPVVLFLVLGNVLVIDKEASAAVLEQEMPVNLAILTGIFMAINAVLSLVAIMSIYREGGILKRLRATPLEPLTILGCHVVVKLFFTVVGVALLVLAGRQFIPGLLDVNVPNFMLALLVSTLSILSVGFVIASIVPTARFAQPIASILLYPMLALSGLFFPLEILPRGWQLFAQALPMTHAVTLMQGIWDGESWLSQGPSLFGLAMVFALCSALASRVFRWE
jgi:ABC-2 type transport system permease protein